MRRVMIRNPESGATDDTERAARIARDRGIAVIDTGRPGDAVRIARSEADDADQLLACGGDGTVNEVVRGIDAAGSLDAVEIAIVPTGTGNGFAGNIGLTGVEQAFDVAVDGEVRSLDVGMADESPFVNSCMGGLIAEASEHTSDETKGRIGSLAYVLQALSELREYEGPTLRVTAGASHETRWTGESIALLVGNGRRFTGNGRGQANVEDGRLEVVIVKEAPTIDYLADDALGRLFDGEASHLTRLVASELSITAVDRPMEFSLDGEIVERSELAATVRERAMTIRVGDAYEPSPSQWPAR